MWIFSDFGLHMPALIPAKVRTKAEVMKWTNNGEYELQVRARVREHLQYFMDKYMEAGTYNPEIQATPDKDYNYRFYTTREAYAEGMKQVILAMDYEKFKSTAHRFSWNKKYADALTSIWARLCDLNQPGGIWGPKSAENPRGYDSASKYSSWRNLELEHDEYYDNDAPPLGSSFLEMDYEPSKSMRRREILHDLDTYGIHPDEWADYLPEDEWLLVKKEAKKRIRRGY